MSSGEPNRGGASGAEGRRALELFAEARRLNRWLFSKLAAHVRGDVMEIGSGIGTMSGFIVDAAASAVLTDVEPGCLDALARTFRARPGVAVVRYDLDGPPPAAIAGRRFDAIVAVNVIEHVADDRALVSRLAALLKPGGKLLVYVPACAFAYGSLDRVLGHYRRYTPASLSALLAGAGLAAPPPAYMNLLGLLGWTLSARVLRSRRVSPRQIALFERLMPLVALEDRVRLPLGLGLHAAATKPDAG
jgi:SAM-dependent methyltransferase